MSRFIGFAGLFVMIALAWVFSTKRRAIKLRTVLVGLVLQFFFAALVLN